MERLQLRSCCRRPRLSQNLGALPALVGEAALASDAQLGLRAVDSGAPTPRDAADLVWLQWKVQRWHGRRSMFEHGVKVPSRTTGNCASGELYYLRPRSRSGGSVCRRPYGCSVWNVRVRVALSVLVSGCVPVASRACELAT